MAVLAIIGIYVAFYGVLTTADAGSDNPDTTANPSDGINTGGFGGLDIIGDIINAIISFVVFLFNALTFNVVGAPSYIRVPVALMISSSLVWSAVSLIRGTEG